MSPSFQHGKIVIKMQIMLTLHGREFKRKSEHASTYKTFASTSKRAHIHFLRAIRAKAKFCEHFQIGWDHSIPLGEADGHTAQIARDLRCI